MKRDTGILLAGSLGVLIGLGIYGFKWFTSKRDNEYVEYYGDFHRHFDRNYGDDTHGVELLAMR